MIVYKANKTEIRAITIMATHFEQETQFVKVDIEHSVKTYEDFYDSGIGGMLALKTAEDIIGGLGYVIAPDLHYPRTMAIETFWFVRPEYRGEGIKLWYYFENMARELGCDAVAMIHLSDSHPEILEKLYIRRGYKLVEKHYVKEIQS